MSDANEVESLEDQLALAVAMLMRMSPWKILNDKSSRRVSIETPHGEIGWTYDKRNDALFAQLPKSSKPSDPSCSVERNKECMMQVVSTMDKFHRQLTNVR